MKRHDPLSTTTTRGRSTHLPIMLLFVSAFLLGAGEASGQGKKRQKLVGPREYSAGGPCDTASWKLVFHDEFDGPSIDRNNWVTWFTYSEDGSDRCKGCRVMGTSNTIFRDDLVSVRDGLLVLGVRAEDGEWYGQRKEYAGGMLHSVGDERFGPGRFEVRCRIPHGRGLWPAFWGFGGETEIDVFEFCGERTKWMKGSLHRWGPTKRSHTGKHRTADLADGFHTYAVEWDTDEVRWYLDGRQVLSRSRFVNERGRPLPACGRPAGEFATAPYFPRAEDRINLILDLAVSEPKGYCKGPKTPVAWPADAVFEVDHVRVYQRHPVSPARDRCERMRHLTPADVPAAAPRAGEKRTYVLDGPAGKVDWTVSKGLRIADRSADRVTVEVLRATRGPQWILADVLDDPCASGPLAVRASFVVER